MTSSFANIEHQGIYNDVYYILSQERLFLLRNKQHLNAISCQSPTSSTNLSYSIACTLLTRCDTNYAEHASTSRAKSFIAYALCKICIRERSSAYN